jgi:nucleoside-diphosphate-sugar epimerase
MRVFLAGATGVIGSPLVPQLLKAGHEVMAMTRLVLRAAQLEAAGADPVVCDVFDADGGAGGHGRRLARSGDPPTHRADGAARLGDPNVFNENNRVRTEGTRVLVDAALATGASRVVAKSIAFAYAPTGDRGKEEDAALFTDAPPPFGGAVAAIVELEERVTVTAGIDGLVLRY